jgi:hypothetical protein
VRITVKCISIMNMCRANGLRNQYLYRLTNDLFSVVPELFRSQRVVVDYNTLSIRNYNSYGGVFKKCFKLLHTYC